TLISSSSHRARLASRACLKSRPRAEPVQMGEEGMAGEDTRPRNICKSKYCPVSNRGPPGARRGGQGRGCRAGYNRRPFSAFRSARMFESLTQRLSGTLERLRGRGRLTESNISEAVRRSEEHTSELQSRENLV